jgi:RHS repeat-associated protein
VEKHAYDAQSRGTLSALQDGVDAYTLSYGALQTTVTDALGNVTTYDWTPISGLPYVTKVTGPCSGCGGGGGQVQEWAYDGFGRITSYTNGAGETTTYAYDAANNVQAVTDPLNNQTTYTYDAQHRMLTKTGPDGSLVTYVQGPSGPTSITEKVTASQNRTTGITYTAAGKPWTITDPRGKVTTLGYSATGDLTSATDPLTHATTFDYDVMGRRTTVTDALGHATTTTYDPRGRITRITNNDGTHSDFAYDTSGRRTAVSDPLGRATSYLYDTYGRLEKAVDPLEGVTAYGYDVMSNLVSLTDAAGHTTQFHYDGYNRVDTVTYPAISGVTASESFTYDPAGRLATKTDRRGVITTFTYDAAGRLWKKTYSGGSPPVTDPQVVFTYDSVGRLLTAANGTDTLTWTYDLAGQALTEQSAKNGSTVAYAYDVGGNRLSLTLDGALFVSYAYDDASRLSTITRGASSFGFSYDAANRRTSMTYPNGIATSYTYDALNRLTSLGAVLNGTTPITNFAYTYDSAGNRLTKQQLDHTETYGYDALYRLASASRAGATPPSEWAYSYDSVGNRATGQVDGSILASIYDERNELLVRAGGGSLHVKGTISEPGTATVDGVAARMTAGNTFDADVAAASGGNTLTVVGSDVSGNQATANYSVSLSGAGATYTYDGNGNLATKAEGADTWAYEWNAENQLTRAAKNAVEQARFKYDPIGRRVEKVAAGLTTTWAYDGQAILREANGTSTLEYVAGLGIDEPLASDDGTALSYLHADGLGSVIRQTSATGSVTLTRTYDAWGNMQTGASTGGYAFTGREWDLETGLYYYRARYYDPKIGRFISEDPIGFRGGVNFYPYAQQNPALRSDPSGLRTCVTWADGTITCVQDPSLCLRMGWCTPPPPPPITCGSYYGNFGGGGWTAGQCGSWNTINHAAAKPPIDEQDTAYCGHDRCYGQCATLPAAWQRLFCRAECDTALTRHLLGGGSRNLHAWGAAVFMSNSGGAIWTTATSDEHSSQTPKGNCCGQ